MTDNTPDDLILQTEDLDDLNRRLGMAENRLNAVRSHRLMRQQESLELLTKIEERFIQQRNDMLHAQDHIRRLEKMNRELVGKLRRIVGAVESGMDAADDIFYRMVNVTNEIASFSNQSLAGEYHAHAMLDGLDIDGDAVPAGADAPPPAGPPPAVEVDPPPVGDVAPPPRRPARSIAPVVGPETTTDETADGSAQVLDIKAIFSKG